MNILALIGTVLVIISEMFYGRISLNWVFLLLINFVNLNPQVRIDVYVPHPKHQVKPHSSSWFSAACAAAIVHRNHFFRLYQQNKSSESKVKSRQVVVATGLLKLPTLHMLIKQKCPSLPRNLVLNKGKSAIPPLFNDPEVLSSASDKAKLFPD